MLHLPSNVASERGKSAHLLVCRIWLELVESFIPPGQGEHPLLCRILSPRLSAASPRILGDRPFLSLEVLFHPSLLLAGSNLVHRCLSTRRHLQLPCGLPGIWYTAFEPGGLICLSPPTHDSSWLVWNNNLPLPVCVCVCGPRHVVQLVALLGEGRPRALTPF